MSFRRTRDEWDDFLKRHGAELRACGVPDYVTKDRMRFLLFLDHGFDQVGWAQNRTATPWSPNLITPEQAGRLAGFITHHFSDEQYRGLVKELRGRTG